jgi:hypothetical protein
VRFAAANDLFVEFASVGEDMHARPANETPLEFLAALTRSPTPEEAITFASYLLQRRKAVWWGHECARSVIHLLTDQDRRMLALAETWVREPEEPNRVQALDSAMQCRNKTPGVWIALAAGWSGGSMSLPNLPHVAPPAYLTPRAVNAGVLGALARVDNGHRAQTLRIFTDMAVGLTG